MKTKEERNEKKEYRFLNVCNATFSHDLCLMLTANTKN